MNSSMAPLQGMWLTMMLLLATALVGSTPAPPPGLRLELSHIDSKGNFTTSQLMRRAAHRSRLRAAMRSAKHGGGAGYNPGATSPTWDARSQLRFSGSEYIFDLAIGTPPLPYVALADTGSDLIWTQSQPCTHCSPQATPIYNPFTSRSFSLEPCSSVMCQGTTRFPIIHQCSNGTRPPQLCRYYYSYGDGASSEGVMGRETLTFRGSRPGAFVSVAGVAFGCSNDNKGDMFNSTGTVGLGRGPLSLVAQLGFGKFSYCLTDYFNAKLRSPLLFGSLADLTAAGGRGAVQTTPLIHVPQQATYYYVSLEGISIAGTRLPIPKGAFELKGDGTGGTIFDSGTSFTSLHERAFRVVVGYVDEVLGLPPSNVTDIKDTPCYKLKRGAELPEMPDMVLHFADGADMRLHRDNYMHFDEDSQLCLLITGDPQMSTIGNYQQQNMHVLYDTTEGYLSFVPADCSKL